MAIRFDASGDQVGSTTHIPDYNAEYTISFWFYPYFTTPYAQDSFVWSIRYNSAYTDRISMLTGESSPKLQVQTQTQTMSPGFTANAWQHVAIVRESGLRVYLNGTIAATNLQSISGRPSPVYLAFGYVLLGDPSPASLCDARYADVKIWTAALTSAERELEQYTVRPQRMANLWAWYPMFAGSGERTRDYSGNGRHLTENGTLSDEDNPPVSWGA